MRAAGINDVDCNHCTILIISFFWQSGGGAPDVGGLRARVSDLEEEREEMLCKLEQYEELKSKNGKVIRPVGIRIVNIELLSSILWNNLIISLVNEGREHTKHFIHQAFFILTLSLKELSNNSYG